MQQLWVDKYKPLKVEDYIWQEDQTRDQVLAWIEQGSTDNILMVGPPGVGKSSLARVLMNELGVDSGDVLKINAPREANIDLMREEVHSFINTGGWGGLKYVILEEADGATPRAQDSIKADMEEFSDSVRWILTANSVRRIIPAVQDRCVRLDIVSPNMEKYTLRMVEVLESEGVSLSSDAEYDALDTIIKRNYPSLRRCIRELQRYSTGGSLVSPTEGSSGSSGDWKYEMVKLFKSGDLMSARKYLCENCPRDEMEEVYRWMYDNHEVFSDPEQAIVVIAEGAYKHHIVADPEINLAATMIKLNSM